jgi:hypothetical protein
MPRFISMKHFRTENAEHRCIADKTTVIVGQVLGEVWSVEEKKYVAQNGTATVSLVAYGKFEAIAFDSNKQISADAIFLPNYYADSLRRALIHERESGNNGAIIFGIEIDMLYEPKSVTKYTYEVRNVTGIGHSRPIQGLKKLMAANGSLKLPPPVEAPTAIPDELREFMEPRPAPAAPARLDYSNTGFAGSVIDAETGDEFEEAIAIAGEDAPEAAPAGSMRAVAAEVQAKGNRRQARV